MPTENDLLEELGQLLDYLLEQAKHLAGELVAQQSPDGDAPAFLAFPLSEDEMMAVFIGEDPEAYPAAIEASIMRAGKLAVVMGTHALQRDAKELADRTELFVLTGCRADGEVRLLHAPVLRQPDAPPQVGPWSETLVPDGHYPGRLPQAMRLGFANMVRQSEGRPLLEPLES